MIEQEDVTDRLRRLNRQGAHRFLATVAGRWKHLVFLLASGPSYAIVEDLVKNSGSNDSPAPGGKESRLLSLPEAHIDDSHDPRYYATRAIDLIRDLALAEDGRDPRELVASCGEGAIALAADLDFVVSAAGHASLGLEEHELTAQQEALVGIQDAGLAVADAASAEVRFRSLLATAHSAILETTSGL